MRKEFLLVVVSTLIGLLLLEGSVRLYYVAKDRLPPHADPATRDEWDWMRTHQASQIPASEAMAGFDAELGWTLSTDIDGWVRQKGHGLPAGDLATPADQERFLSHKQSPIQTHLDAFKLSLGDNSPKHVKLTMTRVNRIIDDCEFLFSIGE